MNSPWDSVKMRDILLNRPDTLERAANGAFEDLLDEVALGIAFDVHHSCRLGTWGFDDYSSGEEPAIADEPILNKKQAECLCPNCKRSLAASRFAPHLEKCMGMGRNSSRIASRRIAKDVQISEETEDGDEDWSRSNTRKRTPRSSKRVNRGTTDKKKVARSLNPQVNGEDSSQGLESTEEKVNKRKRHNQTPQPPNNSES